MIAATMKLYLCTLAAHMSVALASPLSAASPPMPQGTCNVVEIWVDPVHGNVGTCSPDPEPPGSMCPTGQWQSWQGAPGQSPFQLTLVQFQADDEGVGFASWVNFQPVVTGTGVPALPGSMQPEFR
jgi:hypothetical protein